MVVLPAGLPPDPAPGSSRCLCRLPRLLPPSLATNSSGPPVPEFLVKGVTQEQARQAADAALPVINKALGERERLPRWGRVRGVHGPGPAGGTVATRLASWKSAGG